ncbi:hypothetical protein GGD81_000698 [Rhodobium orientis]|uniref:Transglycosylase SLT domain-containing protein n=1 Tax=Rhodobium orientis TaxID=34017 RepID=A0A327JTA5_9HYPH|nr:lytic transglycosylase domain-containing protein [Rhodobium orientis]MBB4301681.1 hypothetical protein [Rhodobium orientis]MBK5952375.1 hypothetical protein [Rhodobium orientis]RAI28132.1 hypothetical protein CH339_07225 [Rhodobium orientis]
MKPIQPPMISDRIERAFQVASRATGTPFDYLLQTAGTESSFDAEAKAPTSSATGLFQFIESTWLETMKESGPALGYGNYAEHIERTQSGDYRVADRRMRAKILDLRNDPKASALMAGAYTEKNQAQLSSSLGREPTSGELYIAHFLGANGAQKLISLAEARPEKNAAAVFPAQARANRSIFYNAGGRPRSVSQVYDTLVSRHGATAIASARQPAATAQQQATQVAANGARSVDEAFEMTSANLVTSFAPTLDTGNRVQRGWQAAESNAPFSVLFRDNPNASTDPVGPTFWGAFAAAPDFFGNRDAKPAPAVPAQPATRTPAAATETDTAERAEARAEQSARDAARLRSRARRARGPLNLTSFLDTQSGRGPKNLLPPS